MLQTAKIKIRDIKEMQSDNVILSQNSLTPLRKRKNPKSSTAKSKQIDVPQEGNKSIVDNTAIINTIAQTTTKKKLIKSPLKETPANQKRIDSYFFSCPKTYEIKLSLKEEAPATLIKTKFKKSSKKSNAGNSKGKSKIIKVSPSRVRTGRKRLFSDNTDTTVEGMSTVSSLKVRAIKNVQPIESINLLTDSEDEGDVKLNSKEESSVATNTSSSLSFGLRSSKTSLERNQISSVPSSGTRRKRKPCPPYKVIENTTFAVDAFQFGYIENVSHYFLTHFHADHYIGLTKSFAMPILVSPITACLLRTFIPLEEQYIQVLELNVPVVIDNIEITALDANHCPGSILLVFKFLNSGKCVLHTGDFRAWHGMESEPIFWNNHINTIYLDTTYISDKYAFCTQYESIKKAEYLIEKFHLKHPGKRILYICGSYLIGKEKFWCELAETYNLKVWTESNRYKALQAINKEKYNRLLVEDPNEANMHVIAMAKLSYLSLLDYFKLYEHQYDIVFAMRPSGWEKNTKPRYSNKINVIGIEYSEHSSYAEMQRFVKFIKPDRVISTVPTGRDLMKTANVPLNWYKYDQLKVSSNYQPSIDSFLGKTPQRKATICPPNTKKGGVDSFVSPLKLLTLPPNNVNKNTENDKAAPISLLSHETCNTPKPKGSSITKTSKSRHSNDSSEDFEKPNIVSNTTSLSTIKKVLPKKDQTKTVKLQHVKNELRSKDANIKTKYPKAKETKQNELSNSQRISEQNLEMTCSQKRITRSASGKTDTSTLAHLSKSKENPIFKSNTTTSVDSICGDEEFQTTNMITSSPEINKLNPNTSASNSSEEMTYNAKLTGSKRPGLSRSNSTPFKKSKATFNVNDILNRILEKREGIDRFNCSQLAGPVMDIINICNPDNGKDHIPAELRSDADDDWI